MNFKKFFFDTNQIKGMPVSQEHWRIILQKFYSCYPENDPYACRQHRNKTDDFGQYTEHSGSKTLGQFFDENGMEKI
jgi:hypothetical protein